jgi:hypothetical protein
LLPVSFPSHSQVAYTHVGVDRAHIAVQEEIATIQVLRSANEKRAADAATAR